MLEISSCCFKFHGNLHNFLTWVTVLCTGVYVKNIMYVNFVLFVKQKQVKNNL